MATQFEETPLEFDSRQLKILNSQVLKAGQVAQVMENLNEAMNLAVEIDWMEALLAAFGLNLQKVIENWIRSIFGGGIAGRVAKAMLSRVGALVTILLNLLKTVWTKLANELLRQTINGFFVGAWAELSSQILTQSNGPRRTKETYSRG